MPPAAPTVRTAADTNPRRVLRVLRYLAGHRPALTSAIARDCHLPRSSTYRLLHALAAEQFAVFDPLAKRWHLGPSAHVVAASYCLSDVLARQSAAVLARLASQTGALIAAVGVLDGTEVMMVASQPHDTISTTSCGVPGMRYPAHLTATGKALLASRTRGELLALYGTSPLAQPAGRGPATVEDLLVELRDIGTRGFEESAADLGDGMWAVAAQVRGTAGRVVGAIGAAFPERPASDPARRHRSEVLTSAAAELSARFGYHPEQPTTTHT